MDHDDWVDSLMYALKQTTAPKPYYDPFVPFEEREPGMCMDNAEALKISPPHNGFSDSDSEFEMSFDDRAAELGKLQHLQWERTVMMQLQSKRDIVTSLTMS